MQLDSAGWCYHNYKILQGNHEALRKHYSQQCDYHVQIMKKRLQLLESNIGMLTEQNTHLKSELAQVRIYHGTPSHRSVLKFPLCRCKQQATMEFSFGRYLKSKGAHMKQNSVKPRFLTLVHSIPADMATKSV